MRAVSRLLLKIQIVFWSLIKMVQTGMLRDSIVLHTTSGDKQVTIAGILATSTASAVNGAGSSGYMICSEQTFTALVGDLGYTTIDVQFSSAGGG